MAKNAEETKVPKKRGRKPNAEKEGISEDTGLPFLKLSEVAPTTKRQINKLADHLQVRINIFREYPLSEFLNMDQFPIFKKEQKNTVVLFLLRHPLRDSTIKLESMPLNCGFLHYLYSDTWLIGYAFDLVRNVRVDFTPYYFIASDRKLGGAKGALDFTTLSKTELSTEKFTVFGLGEELLMVCQKKPVFPLFNT